jgi:hypothetical protein
MTAFVPELGWLLFCVLSLYVIGTWRSKRDRWPDRVSEQTLRRYQ